MKKDLNRALNAFAAMDDLPESMLLGAEQALLDAEGGLPTPRKPPSVFVRFLNSGWGAAVISGIVALGVLILVLRAGREPATYEPPKKPVGSTIEMSTEGVNFTISTEMENYPEDTNRFTVIMTGKAKGETISMWGGWHLERLTAEGAETVEISYTEEALISANPGKDEYATMKKSIFGTNTGGGFQPGRYRLHATKHDGEKYVSVAWCTFTVGDPGDLTWGEDTRPSETDPAVEYPPASDRPYTVTTADTVEYGATGLGITVKAVEPGVTLFPHRNYRIVKLAGPANGEGAVWMQTAEAVEVRPSEENGGYAVFRDSVTLQSPEEWLPGLYRLYALNHDGEYIDYCDFVIQPDERNLPFSVSMERVLYTEADTELAILFEAYQPGRPISRGDCWSLWRVEDGKRIPMGSQTAEYAIEGAEVAPDEYAVEHFRPTVSLVTGGKHKTLPAGQYELIFDPGAVPYGYAVTLFFEVVSLPEQAPESGVGSGRG